MKTRIVSMICGLLFISMTTVAQNKLSGTVQTQEGKPITGAKVLIKGTYLGSYSNSEGIYELTKVPKGNQTIIVRMVGFEPMEQNVQLTPSDQEFNFTMTENVQEMMEVVVIDLKANDRTPTTYTNLKTKEIEKANYGQDLPMLLRFTPSTVVTSDAGAGVGYTGIRIRGVDPTRTNVTINGIPINDSESHGVFWVNMPDFSSSVGDIQVQRGVGTSANGAAAFGASVNINTIKLQKESYGIIDNGYGAFNTWRHTVKAVTGLINNKFTLDARLSKISSDGYIDRASSDLKSFYLAGSWQGKKSVVTANIFSGREVTYQAWYGTPESVVNGDQNEIIAYADRNYIFGSDRENLLNSGRTYNFYTYENEVDNYGQDHYQLHFSHGFNSQLKLNVKGHYTRGKGYYEQFKTEEDFSTYGFAPVINGTDTISTTNLIRRRWLDNHFYGGIFSLNYKKNGLDVTFGGGANEYIGDHFGEVIWAKYASDSKIRDRYYDNQGSKFEVQSYLKGTYKYNKLVVYADLQVRQINYEFLGIDDVSGALENVSQSVPYTFLNPKLGFMVDINHRNNAYMSIAVANREPVRADFRENTPENRPDHEELINLESGYRYKGRKLIANANLYLMGYKNQLVLTGEVNDVGGYTRTNVDNSYRAGVEIELGYSIFKNLSATANATFSKNKIASFSEYVFNYDTNTEDELMHTNTDLAFSPNFIAAVGLIYEPMKGFEIGMISKYVGYQYLDNTMSDERKIDDYFFANFQLTYTLKNILFKEMTFGLQINNAFNKMYENNGYTWGFISGGERISENFYYPQAGRNFMTRLTISL